jgi:trigger factor
MLKELKYKLSREENSKHYKLWKCDVSKENLMILLDKTLENEVQDKVKLDGFRKGKAPLDLLKKEYGDRALSIACRNFIQDITQEIATKEGYKPAISPDVKIEKEIKIGESFKFTVAFILPPEIEEIKFEKISIDVNRVKFTQEEQAEEINKFLENYPVNKLIEDESYITQNKDIVYIAFSGKVNGNEIEGGSADSYELELGSKSFIDTFEDQLIGKKKGDFVIVKVKFPENYHSSELAGKDATFDVVIKDIFKKELPTLNEDFAKKLKFQSVEELKEKVLENRISYFLMLEKQIKKEQIYDKIINKFDVEIGRELIDKELESRLSSEKQRAQEAQGVKFDEKSFIKKMRSEIEFSIKVFYINQYIVNKYALKHTQQDINNYLFEKAVRERQDIKAIQEKFAKDENFSLNVRVQIEEQKAYSYIFDNLKNIKEMNAKDFDKYVNKAIEERKKLNS